MAEWLKAHDSKSCGRVNRLGGSNPLASARNKKKGPWAFVFVPPSGGARGSLSSRFRH